MSPKRMGGPLSAVLGQHVTTLLSPEYEAMLGERVGKDWGINEPGMKQTTQI